MSVIIDTNVFVAYDHTSEADHERATTIMHRILSQEFGSPILCDYVFDEILNVITVRRGKKLALELGQTLLSSGLSIEHVNERTFQQAWEIFQKSSGLSFTDCIIISMAREKHASITTFESRFAQFKDLRIVS